MSFQICTHFFILWNKREDPMLFVLQKYAFLCFTEERKSDEFGCTWRWVNDDRIFISGCLCWQTVMLKFWKGAYVWSWKEKLNMMKFERLYSSGFIRIMTHFEPPWDSISQSDVIKGQYVDESSFWWGFCWIVHALSCWPSSLCKHRWASGVTSLLEQKHTKLKQKKSVKSAKW